MMKKPRSIPLLSENLALSTLVGEEEGEGLSQPIGTPRSREAQCSSGLAGWAQRPSPTLLLQGLYPLTKDSWLPSLLCASMSPN